METRAFYGESGLRNFEARNYMEKLDLRQIVNMETIWRFGLSFFSIWRFRTFEAPSSQGFQVHTMCSGFFFFT